MKNTNYFDPNVRLQLYRDIFSNIMVFDEYEDLDYKQFDNYDKYSEEDEDYDNIPTETIISIHEKYQIPIEIIRSDICNMYRFCSRDKSNIIVPDTSNMSIDEGDRLLDYWNNPDNNNQVQKDIINGKYDNQAFQLDGIIDSSSDDMYDLRFQLSISEVELRALESLNQRGISTDTIAQQLYMKDSIKFKPAAPGIMEMLDIVNKAISQKHFISFNYKDSAKKIASYTIAPLKIIFDSILNIYAILTVYDGHTCVFRLDRIQPAVGDYSGDFSAYVKILDKAIPANHEIYLKQEYFEAIAPYVWGMQFMENEPVKVKVRFAKFGNVVSKVKQDLSYRKGSILEDNDYIYYEDKVYGINSFKAWVRSYGASATVIQPAFLRKEFIAEIKAQLEYYK